MKTLAALLYVLVLFFLLMLFSGCSPAGENATPGQLAFYPEDAAAWEAFGAAADRFEEVAGVRPYTALAGTPVAFVPRPAGVTSCADTTVVFLPPNDVQSVRIDVYTDTERCFKDPSVTLTHEIIHAVRAKAGMIEMAHTVEGLFRLNAGDDRFEETTLNAFCEAVDCITYNPEK